MLNGIIHSSILLAFFSHVFAGEFEQSFLHPPPSARPWVFWFWLNGNVTSNGITADLEAMQRVGIGGVVIMDVNQGTPSGPIMFNSPEWINLFKHTCAEAHRLGMQVNINNDAGWAGSGGPWITPDVSMQKLVCSETHIKGGQTFDALLKQPETIRGFYRDIGVLAFPSTETDAPLMRDGSPTISASVMGPDFSGVKLMDGDFSTGITLPRPDPGKPQFVQIAFPQPFRCRRLALNAPGLTSHKMCHAVLQASQDGTNFTTVREFNAEAASLSVNFPEVESRIFRIRFENAEPYMEALNITEVELSPYSRIDNYQEKALFVPRSEYTDTNRYAFLPPDLAIQHTQEIDLSSKMEESGRLHWDVPAGDWTILRFGHTSTGEDNQPAPESGRGLECDKLSKAGSSAAFNGFIGKLIQAVGPLAGKTFAATHVDSWEVGAQNWTAEFRNEFQRRRGYDPMPYLPVMTGRVVDSLEISERFLWDLRQTVNEMLVENYAGNLSALARRQGMYLTMEAYDLNPCDDLMFAGHVDQPMAEFWCWPPYAVAYSCMEMTSAGHTYGKPIVSGEAFTSTDVEKWLGHPYGVKVFGDWAFCHGINRFILHRYAHQPWTNPTRFPGMAMGPWGLHYERTQTWWEQSKPWHEYLARCQYLLQQGRFSADICYVSPEESPNRWYVPGKSRERPAYNYDACPPELVIDKMFVRNGKVCLPASHSVGGDDFHVLPNYRDGGEANPERPSSNRRESIAQSEPAGPAYRVLILSETETMSPKLLRKIKQLVDAGATVIGKKPMRAPGLTDYPNCDAEVKSLSDELWSESSAKPLPGSDPLSVNKNLNRLRKRRVLSGITAEQLLDIDVPPDFICTSRAKPQAIRYIHKIIGDKDLYFLANKFSEPEEAVCEFRVTGKRPELLKPDTGEIEQPAVFHQADGTTCMPIHFDPFGSVFVLFSPVAAAPTAFGAAVEWSVSPRRPTATSASPPQHERGREKMANKYTPPPIYRIIRDGTPILTSEHGRELLQPTNTNKWETNSFTMAAWVRPDVEIDMPEETTFGISGLHVMRNDVLYPPPGDDLYVGSRQAGAGFSVGLNGVCVYEHSASYFAPTLVHSIPVTNWTHLAIVYRDNRPALYVNGRFVHHGIKSDFNVHSGVGVAHTRGVGPFRGEMGGLIQFSRALTDAEVADLAKSMPLPSIVPESQDVNITCTSRGAYQAHIRTAGKYDITLEKGKTIPIHVSDIPAPIDISDPWKLTFPPAPGRDGFHVVPNFYLSPWNEHDDPAIKYFSGTAHYETTFNYDRKLKPKTHRVFLNLGTVAVMAEVTLNGKTFPILWKPPFELDVTDAIKLGRNQLQIKVTNLWPNRMIGDEQLPEDSKRKPNGTLEEWPDWLLKSQPSPTGRQTFTTWRLWKKDGVLQRSGLLGPVKLLFAEQVAFVAKPETLKH